MNTTTYLDTRFVLADQLPQINQTLQNTNIILTGIFVTMIVFTGIFTRYAYNEPTFQKVDETGTK